MAEKLYEGMFVVDSAQFASNPDGVTGEILGILEKAGATPVAHRPWQDGKLAYEIDGRRRGLHYLTYFRMDGEKVNDINRACKLSETVLRHLVIQHPEPLFNAMVEALSTHETTTGAEEEGKAIAAAAAAGREKARRAEEAAGGEEEEESED